MVWVLLVKSDSPFDTDLNLEAPLVALTLGGLSDSSGHHSSLANLSQAY